MHAFPRIALLLGALCAASAAGAQPPAFLVINNTNQVLTCSSGSPDGAWDAWFDIQPGANWVSSSGSQEILFQCRPPVEQVSYHLKPGQRYSLLPFGNGVRLVEVSSSPGG